MATWPWECCYGCGANGTSNDYEAAVRDKADHEAACGGVHHGH